VMCFRGVNLASRGLMVPAEVTKKLRGHWREETGLMSCEASNIFELWGGLCPQFVEGNCLVRDPSRW